MRRIASAAAAAAIVAMLGAPACAATCSIASTSGLAFSTYNVFATTGDQTTGSVTINCRGNASATMSLGMGNATTYAPRALLNGTTPLNYNLYLDGGHTTIWGNGTSGTSEYGPTSEPNNTNVTVTIYGDIPPGQDVPAGTYSDTIAVTVNF